MMKSGTGPASETKQDCSRLSGRSKLTTAMHHRVVVYRCRGHHARTLTDFRPNSHLPKLRTIERILVYKYGAFISLLPLALSLQPQIVRKS